ncbi:MAG: hypothetical protein AAFY98_00370 [Verrucomicrobiota bacterium]
MSGEKKSWLTLPNCQDAFELVEKGLARPLRLTERVALKYHSGLCLYCSCNREKFDEMMVELKSVEQGRRAQASD